MRRLLEDLWYSYEMQDAVERNEEKKELLDLIVRHEENLHASLTAEQREHLEKYEDCISDLHSLSERDAFIRAVRFATVFLTEALGK